MPLQVAICIGVNYQTHAHGRLEGCVNDAKNLSTFLREHRGFDTVAVMTDEPANIRTSMYPTAQNIVMQLYQLALRTHREHVSDVWISFSGHGIQVRDASGDEADGRDECIVPVDYMQSGVVSDDLLRHVLNMMHPRTRCMVLMDCCHSGTSLDLIYHLDDAYNCERVDDEHVRDALQPDVIMISGCKDAQTSADIQQEGAMTRAFLDTLHNFGYCLTLKGLLYGMRSHIRQRGLEQIPQITMSRARSPMSMAIDLRTSTDSADSTESIAFMHVHAPAP